MALAPGKIHKGDCVELMQRIETATVDLTFADPPFNIGYDYDTYDDRQSYEVYLDWSRRWMGEVVRVLKATGTFWLAIGDDYAAELKLIAQSDLGLTCRSWVIWYYTFGVNCTRKFSRSHTHLFHFVKDPKNFTFNADDPAVRVPSARQLVYADSRANSKGRLPDDTWILRPQDAHTGFSPIDDTWYYARVAGTFKEREGFHGCQMPEQLLGRIIRISSNPGDTVLDPFGGSGTTLAVAKKLGRSRVIGCELSNEYVRRGNARINSVRVGDPLDGPADPVTSAPSTASARANQRSKKSKLPASKQKRVVSDVRDKQPNAASKGKKKPAADDVRAIADAYLQTRHGHSTDRVLADPELNCAFLDRCRKLGAAGKPADWNRMLLRLRKSKRLPRVATQRRTVLARDQMDLFRSGSEIALQMITDKEPVTLDDILCTPELVEEFDRLAHAYAPGFTPFNYRWAALCIRKSSKDWKEAAAKLARRGIAPKFKRARRISSLDSDRVDSVPGLYLLRDDRNRNLYLGESINLNRRIDYQREILGSIHWDQLNVQSIKISVVDNDDLFGLKSVYLGKNATRLNYQPESGLHTTAAA